MVWSPDYLGSPGKVVLSNPLTCTNTPKGENKLYSDAKGVVPSLDLRFAEGKNLNDYMTGQQLIQFSRSSIGTYVDENGIIQTATADTPRFDHDPTTGESLGLLVEESRTNNLKTSNDFSGWLLSNVTNNVSTQLSPDGSFNAAEFETTGNSTTYPYNGKPGTQLPAGTYTFSVWTKFEISFSVLIYGSNLGALLLFDVATKQPSTATIQQGASSFVGTVEEYPNGWYRLSATIIVNSGSLVSEATVALNKNKVTTYGLPDASGVGDVLTIWGAQLEEGSFPTSYIPTSGTALTRSADVASITGSNFSSWYNQSEGSIYAAYDSTGGSPTRAAYGLGSTTSSQGTNNESNPSKFTWFDGSTVLSTVNTFDFSTGVGKTAAGFTDTAVSICLEGGTVATGTQAAYTDTQIVLGARGAGTTKFLNGHLVRLTYFPERLPDSSLQTMTTP